MSAKITKESFLLSAKETTKSCGSLGKAYNLLADGVKMVSKKRLDGLRHIIWLCLVCFFIDYLCKSDHEIDIPYVKRKFEWEDVGAFNVWWSKVSCAPPLQTDQS